jgi:threonine/homoserine/homoserine lactone efflux protein
MEFLFVLLGVFAIFIPALMLPGPDFIAVIRSSMTHGATAGILTTLGVSIGLGFYASLSLLGLSAILASYQWLAIAVRICGGCYLIFLGVGLIGATAKMPDVTKAAARPRRKSLMFGLQVTLTNPKAIVLFTSVFATAVSETMPGWVMGLMVGLVMASSLLWYTIVSLFMSSGPVMRRFNKSLHWIERIAGAGFIVLGGKVLADSRNPVTP